MFRILDIKRILKFYRHVNIHIKDIIRDTKCPHFSNVC